MITLRCAWLIANRSDLRDNQQAPLRVANNPAMDPVILNHLNGRSLTVRIDSAAALRPEQGSSFKVGVQVRNDEDVPVRWTAERPLHLAYRWLSPQEETIVRDGPRTRIPGPLLPGETVQLQLGCLAPNEPGDYVLVVSLVLEGVAWACDGPDAGWDRIAIHVTPPCQWPVELEQSFGGKALRAGLAATRLKDELIAHSKQHCLAMSETLTSPPTLVEGTPQVALGRRREASERSRRIGHRARQWMRRLLGITELQGRFEQIARELGAQVHSVGERVGNLAPAVESQHAMLDRLADASASLAEDAQRKDTAIGELRDAGASLKRAVAALASEVSKELPGRHQDLLEHITRTEISVAQRLANHQQAAARSAAKTGSKLSGDFKDLRNNVDALSKSQDSFRTTISRLVQSDRSVVHELQHGAAVVEIISTLRDIATCVKDDAALEDIKTHIHDVSEKEALYEKNWAYLFAKLDSLLIRQSIPLASSGLVLLRNRFGLLAIEDSDPLAIGYYSSSDLPERATVALIESLLRPGETFVDVGANVGVYTLIAGRKVGATGKVLAFEPASSTCDALRATVAVNGLTRQVEIQECALGSEDGTAELYLAPTSGHNSLVPGLGTSIHAQEIQIRRGDEVLRETQPALIKVDVEGWELDVLEGLTQILDTSRSTNLIVEYSPKHIRHRGMSRENWFGRIKAIRGNVWRLDDEQLALFPVSQAQELPIEGCNLFAGDALPKALEFLLK